MPLIFDGVNDREPDRFELEQDNKRQAKRIESLKAELSAAREEYSELNLALRDQHGRAIARAEQAEKDLKDVREFAWDNAQDLRGKLEQAEADKCRLIHQLSGEQIAVQQLEAKLAEVEKEAKRTNELLRIHICVANQQSNTYRKALEEIDQSRKRSSVDCADLPEQQVSDLWVALHRLWTIARQALQPTPEKPCETCGGSGRKNRGSKYAGHENWTEPCPDCEKGRQMCKRCNGHGELLGPQDERYPCPTCQNPLR